MKALTGRTPPHDLAHTSDGDLEVALAKGIGVEPGDGGFVPGCGFRDDEVHHTSGTHRAVQGMVGLHAEIAGVADVDGQLWVHRGFLQSGVRSPSVGVRAPLAQGNRGGALESIRSSLEHDGSERPDQDALSDDARAQVPRCVAR